MPHDRAAFSAASAHHAYPCAELRVPDAARLAGVRVVRVDFAFDVPLDAPDYAALSADERERAMRFLRVEDRVRSAATRCALRAIVGAVLDVSPFELRFVRDAQGRPALAPEYAVRAPGLDFNVSHAGAHALVALCASARVGVDIEAIKPRTDWRTLAPAVFAERDAQAVGAMPAPQREAAFYRVWTAKEALLKALGAGIAAGLTGFSVLDCGKDKDSGSGRDDQGAAPTVPVVHVADPTSPAGGVAGFAAGWLDAPAGYAACVAWRRS